MIRNIIWIGLILIGILGIIVEIKFKTINILSFILSIVFIAAGMIVRRKVKKNSNK